jgi:hypothetical protein
MEMSWNGELNRRPPVLGPWNCIRFSFQLSVSVTCSLLQFSLCSVGMVQKFCLETNRHCWHWGCAPDSRHDRQLPGSWWACRLPRWARATGAGAVQANTAPPCHHQSYLLQKIIQHSNSCMHQVSRCFNFKKHCRHTVYSMYTNKM